MPKIYTKTGDKGTTQLADGTRVAKSSERIEGCGSIDELNAFLGLALTYINRQHPCAAEISRIQQELILLNSQLALASKTETITILMVEKLEQEIDAMNSKLPPLTKFILPGGNKASAILHVARTVCRKVERIIVKLEVKGAVIPYLNRLSDWLFVAARFIENKEDINEDIVG